MAVPGRLPRRTRVRRKPLAALPESVAAHAASGRKPAELDLELDRLPAIDREPLVLVYLYGLSNAEAALPGTSRVKVWTSPCVRRRD